MGTHLQRVAGGGRRPAIQEQKKGGSPERTAFIMNSRSSVYTGCTFSACQPFGPLTTLN